MTKAIRAGETACPTRFISYPPVRYCPERHGPDSHGADRNGPDRCSKVGQALSPARLLALLILALTLVPAGRAQQFASAGIFGDVVDAQGAVMPGAKVTLTDVDRNQERSMTTNTAGEFSFPL